MGFFPLYRDNSLIGPSYVSLSIPPIPSAILKSLNMEGNSSFLLPNIDYMKKVLDGDLGIADIAIKNMIFKQINSPLAIVDLAVIKKYSEISSLKLSSSNFKKSNENGDNNLKILSDGDFSKYKRGKIFRIPKSDISPPEELVGFKSLEMVTLKSIFETQKPYIEIAKIILDSFASIEDIMARVMPIASSNPLTHRSKKPVANSGSGNRPKAIGFAGGKEIKQLSNDLKSLNTDKKNKNSTTSSSNKTTKLSTKSTEENVINTNIDSTSSTSYDDPVLRELSKNYKIINVQYSTGIFISGTDYQYSYIELPPDPETLNNQLEADIEEEDLYDKWKPKNLLFGIFDSNGLPVNPDEYLKTSGYSGNNKTEVTTPFKRVDWIVDNPKWKFKPGEWKWPVLGEPNYVFTNGIFNRVSKTKPQNSDIMPPWKLKVYKEGDKNLINKLDAQPGDPVIDSFDPIDKVIFQNYFREYTELSFRDVELSVDEKNESIKTITSNLEIDSHLENLSKYGQNKSSVYDSSFPEALKKSFSPYKIYVPESKSDPKLSDQNGMIWIDPESDYDLKIIKVIPVKKLNNKSNLNYEYKIKTYIKNILSIKLSDNSNFNIDFYKNSSLEESLSNVNNYILENWNIDGDKIVNTNDFKVNVWSSEPIRKYKNLTYLRWYDISNLYNSSIRKFGDKWTYNDENPLSSKTTGYKKLDDDNTYVYVKDDIIQKWYYLYDVDINLNSNDNFKLPGLGENKIISLDINSSNVSNETKTIPLYQFKVENNGYKVLDPYLLNNKFLSIPELYSKNSYEIGTKSNPQKLEVIERYQLTDLDTETYYIIEGSKIEDKDDNNKNKKNINGKSDSSWYRLPHAVGAFIPFIKLQIKIFSKLIPAINKLINLLSNPTSFITDIVSEKLSESFPFLSKESFNTFKNLSEKLKKKDNIIKERGGLFYINDVTNSLSSELKNLTFVNKYGIKKPTNNVGNTLNNVSSNVGNLPNNENLWDKRPSILKNNEGFGDIAFLLDGKATIPFKVLGIEFNFGMELKMLNLLYNKPPLKLIFDSNLGINKKTKKQYINSPITNKNNVNNTIGSNITGGSTIPPLKSKDLDPKQFEIVSIWYSTGKYIEGVDYEYSYVTIEEEQLLDHVDELIETNQIENLEIAKNKLNNQLIKNPNSQPIKNKLSIVDKLLEALNAEIQPILKILLSLVTTPLTIIGNIIQYILNFFKSLTNPIKLPIKIAEFLSFKWILDFFTPKGIMEIMGIKFKPELLPVWIGIASATTGASMFSDDYELADLNEFFSAPFLPKLPIYTLGNYKQKIKVGDPLFPMSFVTPSLCFIEKIINGFIDFIWSLMGIEPLIKPPHIKLCPETTKPENIQKILNGESPKPGEKNTDDVDGNTTEVMSTDPYVERIAVDSFVYMVKMPNGETKEFIDRNLLDKFIEDNKDINFEFDF
jgi:hypothetical protein